MESIGERKDVVKRCLTYMIFLRKSILSYLVFRPPGWDPLSHRTSALSANIIDLLVWAPGKLQSTQCITAAVSCWSWIVSARPELETRLVRFVVLSFLLKTKDYVLCMYVFFVLMINLITLASYHM